MYGPRAPMYDPRVSPVSQQQRLAQQSNMPKVSPPSKQQQKQKVAVAEAYTNGNTMNNRHAEPDNYEIMVDHGRKKVWRCIYRTCRMSNMRICFYAPASTHVMHFSAHKRSSRASSIAIHVFVPARFTGVFNQAFVYTRMFYSVCVCVCVCACVCVNVCV